MRHTIFFFFLVGATRSDAFVAPCGGVGAARSSVQPGSPLLLQPRLVDPVTVLTASASSSEEPSTSKVGAWLSTVVNETWEEEDAATLAAIIGAEVGEKVGSLLLYDERDELKAALESARSAAGAKIKGGDVQRILKALETAYTPAWASSTPCATPLKWESCEVPSVTRDGNTITIENFYLSGLTDEDQTDPVVLYERKEVTDLRTAIVEKEKNRKTKGGVQCCGGFRVWGPPGCGKSRTTFACVVELAAEQTMSLLWVHYGLKDDDDAIALRLFYDESGEKCAERAKITGGADGLKKAMHERDYGILVVDGCVANTHDRHKNAAYRYALTGALVIVVGSTQMSDSYHEMRLQYLMERRVYNAFIVDDVVAAAKVPAIWKSHCENFKEEFGYLKANGEMMGSSVNDATQSDIEKLVDRKAYFAGSSARWHLDFDTKSLKLDIDDHVSKIANVDDLAKGVVGAMSAPAVNHLMTPIVGTKNAYTIVSQYALDALLEGPNPVMSFQMAHQILQGKPQAIGWLIEREYVSMVKRRGTPMVLGKMPFPYALTADDVKRMKAGVLVEPAASNQPAFDLIQLKKERIGEKDVVRITMTQVSKQIEGKKFNANLILDQIVKLVAKLELDPSLLSLRVIPMLPESVLPGKVFKPKPTALPLVSSQENYTETILSIAPDVHIKDFSSVAKTFKLQHDGTEMTLETLYDEEKIKQHLSDNLCTFETASPVK